MKKENTKQKLTLTSVSCSMTFFFRKTPKILQKMSGFLRDDLFFRNHFLACPWYLASSILILGLEIEKSVFGLGLGFFFLVLGIQRWILDSNSGSSSLKENFSKSAKIDTGPQTLSGSSAAIEINRYSHYGGRFSFKSKGTGA